MESIQLQAPDGLYFMPVVGLYTSTWSTRVTSTNHSGGASLYDPLEICCFRATNRFYPANPAALDFIPYVAGLRLTGEQQLGQITAQDLYPMYHYGSVASSGTSVHRYGLPDLDLSLMPQKT